MSDLAHQQCLPCRGGVPPLRGAALDEMLRRLGGGWSVVNEHHLEKAFQFKTYAACLAFTNRVAGLAESVNHHPDIHLAWGKVTITIWTHKIDGLNEADFIFAAKTDQLVSPE